MSAPLTFGAGAMASGASLSYPMCSVRFLPDHCVIESRHVANAISKHARDRVLTDAVIAWSDVSVTRVGPVLGWGLLLRGEAGGTLGLWAPRIAEKYTEATGVRRETIARSRRLLVLSVQAGTGADLPDARE